MWQVTNYAQKPAPNVLMHVVVTVCLSKHVEPNMLIESELMLLTELTLVNAKHVYKPGAETALNEADRARHFNKWMAPILK